MLFRSAPLIIFEKEDIEINGNINGNINAQVLKIDEDAHFINTDNLNIDQVVMMIKDLIPND